VCAAIVQEQPSDTPQNVMRRPDAAIELARASPNTWPWVLGYSLVLLSIWSLVGRYGGITHDAVLYLLQAVSKLTPDPLAQDVFLRFESQDRFTVFSRICAWVVQVLGVDHAASLLTFVFLLSWYLVAWAVARRLQDGRLALLSLSLLLLIPGLYGAMRVFRYAESFMTPRSLAEALSLAAILALLNARRGLALLLMIPALLVHPLMAFPGALFLAAYASPLRRTRDWLLVAALTVVCAVAGAWLVGLPDPFMRGNWLEATRLRSLFLFTDNWGAGDWEIATQILLTLLLGIAALPKDHAQRALVSALFVGAIGLVLAIVSSQLLELKVLLQGQPWRWMWLGRFFATVLLPLILVTIWREGPAGRSAAMLLASAWLLGGLGSLRDVPPVGVSGLLCLLSLVVWHARASLKGRSPFTVEALGISVLAAVGVIFLSFVLLSVGNDFSFGFDPLWVQRVHDVIGIPGIAAAAAAGAWWALIVRQSRAALVVLAALSAGLIAGTAPENHRRWTMAFYDDTHRSAFAEWRSLIPKEAEVLWPNGAQAVWFLLDRRSYLSVAQGAGSVFSSRTTDELLRRAQLLAPWVHPGVWFLDPKSMKEVAADLTPGVLRRICVDPSLGFVVSERLFDGWVGHARWPTPGDSLYLYDCADFRAGRSR